MLPIVGTMNFGGRVDEASSARIIRRALERGAIHFDTANAYNKGESERVLGRALGRDAASAFITSKVGFGRRDGRPEGLGGGVVRSAVRESLDRIGVGTIDLYLLHVPDYATDTRETLEAVRTLLDEGLIRAYGVSNYASWHIMETQRVADALSMPGPRVAQQLYNLMVRQLDVEYFKFTRRYPIHTTAYNALAGGLLAKPYTFDAPPDGGRFFKNTMYQRRYWTKALFAHKAELARVAADAGLDLITFAYRWLSSHEGVDSILIGPTTVEQLDVALDAIGTPLEADVLSAVDEATRAFLGTEATYAR